MSTDRREREEKIREIKELYDFVAEQVLAGLFKTDIIGKLIELGTDKVTATELVEEMAVRLQKLRKRKILLIIPQGELKDQLDKQLRSVGYQLFLSENGDEGLKIIDEHMPDLILLHTELPGMGVSGLIQQIREDAIGYKTPLIILSERKSIKDAILVHGLAEFYESPFSIDQIVERIKKFLVYPKNPYV